MNPVLRVRGGAWAMRVAFAIFGVNLMTLPPGNWSSQRHWHSHEDEFVYLLEGELVLIEDGSETLLHPGLRCVSERHRQRSSPDQQVLCDGRLSRGGVSQP